MTRMTNLIIDFQRLQFRIKRKRQLNKLEKAKRKTVKEAERLKNITGKRHYVLLLDDQYVVRNSQQLKEVNKLLPAKAKINVLTRDKITVHITK
jgi:hypothetical protein